MRLAPLRSSTALLAVLLIGAVRGGAIGFADLPRLVAAHPLHSALAQYDREIAALHSTQSVPGLADPAARAQSDAAALQRDAASASTRARRLGASAAADLREESAALSAIGALGTAGERDVAAYESELRRETASSIAAFQRATVQRIARAYEARRQQLREKELTLAYNLARQDAPTRLSLGLKLDNDAYLSHAARATLRSELAALDGQESTALSQMKRNDSAILASYLGELQRDGSATNARMSAQLVAKAEANLSIRRRASAAESRASGELPSLPSQLALFKSTYRSHSDASAIASGFQSAGVRISGRFAQLAQADRQSRAATAQQLRKLEADRGELYRAIVAQIERAAERLGRERRLAIVVSDSRPKGSVDVTTEIRGELMP